MMLFKTQLSEVCHIIQKHVREFQQAQYDQVMGEPSVAPPVLEVREEWKKPGPDQVKVNVDTTF
jgi:hypothetical protein